MALQWSDAYSVEIELIDRQHRKLFTIVNELGSAAEQGKTKEALGRALDELIAYTKEHFKTEEDLFQTHSYPEATAHKEQHDQFVEKVGDFRERFDEGKLTMTVEVRLFLTDWLVNHIKKTDKKYSAFLLAAGVPAKVT